MKEKEKKKKWGKRITGALWGALLGVLLGTAVSSALARIVETDLLKALLVDGFDITIPELSSSLGFFSIKLGFSLRFTLLSGLFMTAAALLLLFLPFKDESG